MESDIEFLRLQIQTKRNFILKKIEGREPSPYVDRAHGAVDALNSILNLIEEIQSFDSLPLPPTAG